MMSAAYRMVLMDSQEEEAILNSRPSCGSTVLFAGDFWVPAVCSAPSQALGDTRWRESTGSALKKCRSGWEAGHP